MKEIIDGCWKQTFYFDSPDKLINVEQYYNNGVLQGKAIVYYESEHSIWAWIYRWTCPWKWFILISDKLIQIEQFFVNDTLNGKEISYFQSQNIEYEVEITDLYKENRLLFDFDKLINGEQYYNNGVLQGKQLFIMNPGITNMRLNILMDLLKENRLFILTPLIN